ncbi:MAG: hypothetical protein J6C17_04485 [Clostridia bacterium]|nr:hypothetical protein [Clostridia bacterium]
MNENMNGACENCGINGTLKNINGKFLCPMCRKKIFHQEKFRVFTFSKVKRATLSVALGIVTVAIVIYALYYIATGSALFNIF